MRDKRPHELPLAAWSDGLNVRFGQDGAERIAGYKQVYDPPSIPPYHLLYVQVPAGPLWLYPGLAKAYATDGNTHANVTRQSVGVDVDYSATVDLNWTSSVLGGVAVLNNGVDAPQQWLVPALANRLANLSNWPASTTCGALRAFKNFLVALDVTESGTRYPQMVRWSHPADPGGVPASWDYSDPTLDAGRIELKETSDYCVDCATLRDINVIYKEFSTWGMQFIGGIELFRFYKIFDNIGAMTRRCAAEFFSGQHAVLTLDDLVRHDGQNATSLLDRRWRKALFNDLDRSKYTRSFVAVDYPNDEVWVCYVPNGATLCSRALVWNFRDDKLSFRELPSVAHIATGAVDFTGIVSNTWDSDSGSWDSDTTYWDFSSYDPTTRRLLMAGAGSTHLFGSPFSTAANGATFSAFLERKGLGFPLRTDGPPDITTVKQVRRIWPHVEGENGQTLQFYVGGQEDVDAEPVYTGPYDFVIGETRHVDCLVTSRLHALKVMSVANFDWRLTGYEVDVIARGTI